MKALDFDLSIDALEYQVRYRTLTDVLVLARNGQTVRFPANSLQRFVTREGVHGSFQIRFDEQSKLIELVRIETS